MIFQTVLHALLFLLPQHRGCCDAHIFRIFKNKLQLVAKYVSQKNAGQVFDSSYTVQGLLCIKIHMSSIRLNVALATGNFCMSESLLIVELEHLSKWDYIFQNTEQGKSSSLGLCGTLWLPAQWALKPASSGHCLYIVGATLQPFLRSSQGICRLFVSFHRNVNFNILSIWLKCYFSKQWCSQRTLPQEPLVQSTA